jgi:carbon monoxide dehydrogenase subunit G
MEFDNSFEVPLAPDAAWAILLDVPRVAPCLPGAELTETIDANNYRGKVSVRLGPIALAFSGTATLQNVDDVKHTASIKAAGTDTKGRGAANALVDFRLEPVATGTKVLVHTDLKLTGMVAQYGRGAGMIQAVADQLIGQFVAALNQEIARSTPASTGPGPEAVPVAEAVPALATPRPISGFALLWAAFKGWLRSAFWGRPPA